MKTPRSGTSGERAIAALEGLLTRQRHALAAGELQALETATGQIQALTANAAWRRDVARDVAPQRLRAALAAVSINAALAVRGETQAARALAALGVAPGLYTAAGALGARSTGARHTAA